MGRAAGGTATDGGPWWTFVFESDHPDHPELPMKLLPNKNVELMVQTFSAGDTPDEGDDGLAAGGTLTAGRMLASGELLAAGGTQVFVVSGEVTAFRGENYLLPRVAMRMTDTGNLRK